MNRHAFGDGELQLHCFADASETAYGTCAYVRSLTENEDVRVELLASMSRVAPLQRRTIPRLELCAAQMAALLYHKIVTALDKARKSPKVTSSTLSVEELENAKFTLVKLAQAECYTSELRQLRKRQAVSKSSSLKLFNPFVDSIGIVRVGGRLNLSKEPYAVKHQILLPGFHHFTLLLLKSRHLKLLHGSISLTLAEVRKPTNGRRAVRNVIRNCYRCARVDPRPIKQPIGQLPPARITPGRAFSTTGIDYCGPVFVKHPYRKAAPTKAYIALFVCFATKDVHIELVGDLSTASFISALRRFIARRGKPEHLYSDNATNFAGAKNELNALYQMFSNRTTTEQISTNLVTDGISWHLIPPRAPNFGGLWEAAVKVAKRHLVRQLGNTTLLYEDLVTILAQIEGCMNSRPLIPLSENPEDYEILTPGHFLIGSSPVALPDPDVCNVPSNRLNRYQFIQQRVQQFWHKWRSEYLSELQRQPSSASNKVDLKVGQMVILQDQQQPPTRWPLARIVELHPGQDGITRVVTLRTPTGEFKRACTKLCLLPSIDDYLHHQEE
ncbi:uncharacterized protein LOC129779584 [Toxorhynchites rutilus septentrionalis]|uniref:uncharacterized protein LOC129779584 n=1 Tax=Toxorhynchites rutilus septentrionalis TaxID=329112 RepID=UPI00247A0DAB|nr:uncharacterized protein LOC129779584 [Toxorhynchites rutilus septentrionalis]